MEGATPAASSLGVSMPSWVLHQFAELMIGRSGTLVLHEDSSESARISPDRPNTRQRSIMGLPRCNSDP